MVKIAFTNQKGGVAKTTSAHAIAVALADKGYNVLCVDADPQENLASAAGIDLKEIDPEVVSLEFLDGLVDMHAGLRIIGLDAVDLDEIDMSGYTDRIAKSLEWAKDVMPELFENAKKEKELRRNGEYAGKHATLDKVLRKEAEVEDAIIQIKENLSIIVAGLDLFRAETYLSSSQKAQPGMIMSDCFRSLEGKYDFVIIDCSPAIGRLLTNILAYVDYAIIPVEPSLYATIGIYKLYQEIFEARTLNPRLQVLGWLLTKVKKTGATLTTNAKVWIGAVEDKAADLGATVFENRIFQRVAVEEAQTVGEDIHSYAKDNPAGSKAAEEYVAVTDEILNILGFNARKEA